MSSGACSGGTRTARVRPRRIAALQRPRSESWLHTVPRRHSGRAPRTATGVRPVVSGVKMGPAAYAIDTVPSPGCVLQALRLWWP
eukprot:3497775-Prymnesium_polylepis.1